MAYPDTLSADGAQRRRAFSDRDRDIERPAHTPGAVSWGAIAAGASAAAALSLILLILGVGLGLSSVSPWTDAGVSATTLGVSTIVWLTVTQLLASGMGGYLAGRLRNRWTDAQPDEVFFRDTAHGFLAWAVSSLATAALLTSVIGSIVGGGVQVGASVADGATGMEEEDASAPLAYVVDMLFRQDGSGSAPPASTSVTPFPVGSPPADSAATDAAQAREAAEIGRIFMGQGLSKPLPEDDVRHVARLVAQRTGLSPDDAHKRVTDTYARALARVREAETDARDAADTARKASATGALWLFVSLLTGAFFASLAATLGGRQRDT